VNKYIKDRERDIKEGMDIMNEVHKQVIDELINEFDQQGFISPEEQPPSSESPNVPDQVSIDANVITDPLDMPIQSQVDSSIVTNTDTQSLPAQATPINSQVDGVEFVEPNNTQGIYSELNNQPSDTPPVAPQPEQFASAVVDSPAVENNFLPNLNQTEEVNNEVNLATPVAFTDPAQDMINEQLVPTGNSDSAPSSDSQSAVQPSPDQPHMPPTTGQEVIQPEQVEKPQFAASLTQNPTL
jgi:hypothetical protein